MKTFITFILAATLAGVFCAACDGDKKESEGVNVPFTRYVAEETSFEWTNLYDLDSSERKILIINSDEELSSYIIGDYPHVDFSKKRWYWLMDWNSIKTSLTSII